MDYLVLAGCGLTRSDAAKVLPPVLLVCQRGCKHSTDPLQTYYASLSLLESIIQAIRQWSSQAWKTYIHDNPTIHAKQQLAPLWLHSHQN